MVKALFNSGASKSISSKEASNGPKICSKQKPKDGKLPLNDSHRV